jgi:hypothetical protein
VAVGIKGTRFLFGYDPQSQVSTIIVKEGAVWATPTNHVLRPFTVQAGQQVQVGPNRIGPVTAYKSPPDTHSLSNVWGPREGNTALNGTNLTYYAQPSIDRCQSDCAGNPNCRGFTWIRPGVYNPGDPAMCYLISVVTGRSHVAGHTSAVRR